MQSRRNKKKSNGVLRKALGYLRVDSDGGKDKRMASNRRQLWSDGGQKKVGRQASEDEADAHVVGGAIVGDERRSAVETRWRRYSTQTTKVGRRRVADIILWRGSTDYSMLQAARTLDEGKRDRPGGCREVRQLAGREGERGRETRTEEMKVSWLPSPFEELAACLPGRMTRIGERRKRWAPMAEEI